MKLRMIDQLWPALRRSRAPSETTESPGFTPERISNELSNARPNFTERRSKWPEPLSTKICASFPSLITAEAGTTIPCEEERKTRMEPNMAGFVRPPGVGSAARQSHERGG